MFAVGRLFAGAGAFSFMLCSIVYVGEVSPASRRGLLGALVGPRIISGYIVAAFMGLGCAHCATQVIELLD